MRVVDDRKTSAVFRAVMPLALVVLTAMIYLNTLGNGFVYDDHSQIIRNPWIKDIRYLPSVFSSHSFGFLNNSAVPQSYRPMVFVVYMLEYAAFGLQPRGWHLLNSVFHAVNSVMVFALLLRLLDGYRRGDWQEAPVMRYLPPFFGAVLFAVHPVNSEPVSWVGCVPELLYTFLCLTILYSHVKTSGIRHSRDFNNIRYSVLTSLLFFLAILFKETAVFLPAVILVYDYMTAEDGRFLTRQRVVSYIPYAAACAAYIAVRISAIGHLAPERLHHSYLSVFQNLLNAPVLLAGHLTHLIFPADMPFQLFAPVLSVYEPKFLLSVAFISAASALVMLFWKKVHPLYIIALFLILLPLIPTLYTSAISLFPHADRYLYFPSIGLSLFLSTALKRFMDYSLKNGRRRYVWGVAGLFMAVAIFFSWSAEKRSLVWKDDFTLWSMSADGGPENYFALYNIGIVYFTQNRMDEGIRKMEESLEANKLRAHPDKTMLIGAHSSLARAYKEKGLIQKAAEEYREILRFFPEDGQALLNLKALCAEMEPAEGLVPEVCSISARMPPL
ncbi:MAG: tetratricopeptide repeat protein [Deltaproteobacteria bacterium]|nr:tetratricopeptide repeat protein [Deltaproteobacteria bacterium]